MEFLVGETVTIRGKTFDLDTYNLINPDSVTITIKSSAVLVDEVAMTPKGTGEYVYYYDATERGLYTYIITAVKAGRSSKTQGNFKVV